MKTIIVATAIILTIGVGSALVPDRSTSGMFARNPATSGQSGQQINHSLTTLRSSDTVFDGNSLIG